MRSRVHTEKLISFSFIDKPESSPTAYISVGDEPWAAYLGLPDSIVLILARIANLCADISIEGRLDPAIMKKADDIESDLKRWIPDTSISVGTLDSTAQISRTIANQLWRLSANILLYQVNLPLQPPRTWTMRIGLFADKQ